MTAPDMPHLRSEILGEASRWFVELNENPQDEATRQGFDHWLRRSPEHVHAFLKVSAHWEEGAPRRSAPVETVAELVALAKTESNVVHFAQLRAHSATPLSGAAHAGGGAARRFRRWQLALVASVVLSLAGAWVWQQFFLGVYGTGFGEQRSLTLADGSTVDLNSRTRIRVSYTSRERHIDLLEGQALFHVAKNESQPFVVRSGDTLVRAVGTQFDVYRKETGTVVTVVEGRVAVLSVPRDRDSGASEAPVGETIGNSATSAPPRASGSGTADARHAARFLDAGQQLTVGAQAAESLTAARLEPSSIEAATAWTQRRLIFKGAPLAEVVSEFNRYSARPLVIRDPMIAAIPISGSFSSSDPTDLLRFLREVGGYDVHETNSAIEISRR